MAAAGQEWWEIPKVTSIHRLPSLSAFVPVHNERDNVVATMQALWQVLPELASQWEIIIVDDGSRDGTAALIETFAATHAHVRIVRHRYNRGYGVAVRSGVEAARFGHVCFIDGDRQFDPAQLSRLVMAADRADAVVGYRAHRADPLGRRLAGRAWTALVHWALAVRVRDVNCALKLFDRRFFQGATLVTEGAAVSAELLMWVQVRGGHIAEVPVDHFPRRAGRASGAGLRIILQALPELWRLRTRLRGLTPAEVARPAPAERRPSRAHRTADRPRIPAER